MAIINVLYKKLQSYPVVPEDVDLIDRRVVERFAVSYVEHIRRHEELLT